MESNTIIRILVVILIILLVSIIFFLLPEPNTATFDTPLTLKVILNNQPLTLETAKTPEEKEIGLMFRDSMADNQGMIFLYDNADEPKSFWMKNTLIPLDLIFINSSNNIVDIKENFQPCKVEPCEVYTSKPCKDVIELNAGLAKELELRLGDEINIKI